MSRPKSEDKRKAILEAALRVFAEQGIHHAPTSAISRAAGVAEGSLFTYFKTKNDLMNELYLELRQEFSRSLTDFPHRDDARTRLRYVWDKYLDLGKAHPERLKVLAQLRATGALFRENERPAFVFYEVLNATHEVVRGKELGNAPPEYLVLALRSLAETAIEFIQAHPESEPACRESGFQLLWKGLAGK
ncbi:MAG TPA: TetR/AcrR family transcriptional regulator [Terracidiphilus sp.]|nr:TetR/AcrR family transcriptional regulator [Terracidiphilus sp.]